MMLLLRFLPASLLLSAPLAVLAQGPTPRFYVGLAAYNSSYQQISATGGGFPVPVQATAGYQLRPRLAMQLGLAYKGGSFGYGYTNRDYLGNGRVSPPYQYSLTSQRRALSTTLLARYTLTRQPAHRLQFDVLAGLALEYLRNTNHETRTDSAAAPVASTSVYRTTDLQATAGLGVRYRFGPQLEATYNLLFSRTLTNFTTSSDYYDRTVSMALGVQYRFGRR